MSLKKLSVLILGSTLCASAYSMAPIPKESGFSGFINLGAGVAGVESNMLAKTLRGNLDLSDESISDINTGPDKETSALPVFGMELTYTFADTRTQIFFGNRLEDYIRFDLSTRAGVRQEIGTAGIIGANALITAIATEVWEDPYATNTKREATDRTANGYRLNWGRVFGTGLELRYTSRENDLDKERSGEALISDGVISSTESKLLDRNGDTQIIDTRYTFNWGEGRHIITPGITYTNYDLDGAAMAYESYGVNVNYIYSINRWRFVVNAGYADLKRDQVNPIYGKKADAQQYGSSLTTFYASPFGLKGWMANASVIWFEENNDVNFYDTSLQMVSVGMLKRF